MLDKFERFNHRLSGWFEWIGVAGFLAMMLVTVIDVIGAKVFLSPLLGAMDWVRVWQSVAIAFACAATLIIGRHVRVEFIAARLPQRAQDVISSLVNFLCLGLFALLIWRTSMLGYTLQVAGEVSATAHIPRFIFAYGIALAGIPVYLLFLQELISSIIKVVKR